MADNYLMINRPDLSGGTRAWWFWLLALIHMIYINHIGVDPPLNSFLHFPNNTNVQPADRGDLERGATPSRLRR